MAAFFLALVLPTLLIVVSYILQLFHDSHRRLPPGPWPLPVIGNLHQLDHLPHRSLARLAARHGPLMSLRLGAVLTVVASSPDTAREIMQRHNADIAARSIGDSMRAGGHCENSVLCLPPRRRWRALRRLGITELFSPQRLRATEPLRRETVSGLVRRVSEHAARGEAVDVGRAAHAAALGLLSRTVFSADLDPATAREVSDIVDEASVLAAGPNVSDFFPALAPADLQGVRRRMARLVRRMYAIIDEQIEQRERSRASGEACKNDLLDVMLDKEGEVEEESTDAMSHNTIRGLFTIMAFFLLCISSLLLIFVTTYIFQPLIDARRRLPPGPRRLPVIGNLHSIGSKKNPPHRAFAALADRYGPLVSIRLGCVRAVVASSSDVAREVMHRHNADLAGRGGMDAWHACGHHAHSIIALPPRRKWRALRKLCAEEMLAPRRLAELRAEREEEARELARGVSSEAAKGSPVAVARTVFPRVAGVLWRSMFSEELDAATARELGEVVREAVVVAGAPNLSDYLPALAAADLLGVRRRMEKLVGWTYGVIDRQVELRRRARAAGEPRKNDLLDAALDMEGEVEGEGWAMNQEAMRGMFMDLLVAGSGSTTSTIEWAMAELLQNTRCLDKVQKELKGVLGKRTHVTESDINQLPYLQAVVKETLRLHPTVPIGLSKAEATVAIQGYRIPKGTTVYVNIWAICRRARVWVDPEKFVPERFADKDVSFLGTNFELIPFGAGRRVCLGLPLAERMLHLMLAALLHQFQWTLPDDGHVGGDAGAVDMAEQFGLVLSMATPLRAVAKEI
ncbi:Cytochrome P450 76C4 [Dichanthelium oligosanthes]|uniref:Cytochrome P450 76C4 n=1 Tax=Dichanthelium oligosanthes TaxID=888268 RepID=A0A1E5V3E8_9POAL|nr:Cytochrome P450 76C4 [Dichanthelium oligosanthes]